MTQSNMENQENSKPKNTTTDKVKTTSTANTGA